MLNLNIVSKACLLQSGYRNQRIKRFFAHVPGLQKDRCSISSSRVFNICSSVINCEHLTKNINFLTIKRSVVQVATKEYTKSKSNFQQLFHHRKKQAERSVLLELSKKEDIPYALNSCQKFGVLTKAYSYAGENENIFLLLEFSEETASKRLLSSSQCRNTSDAFSIFSRILQFDRKSDAISPNELIEVIEEKFSTDALGKNASLSELIENIYLKERITELNTRLRYFLCALIKDSISGLFPYCDVLPFGSSVNGIGRHGCDLDVMIRLYPEEITNGGEFYFTNKTCIGDIRALQQKTTFCLGEYFRTFFPGVSYVHKIIHARIPIIKLKHKILNMECDVSINNMSAVLMSEVIYFCGEIDSRVQPLLYAVKKWAKDANITHEEPGAWITNFGLTALVLCFLQHRPVPILPPFNDAFVILGEDTTPDYRVQYLKSVEELSSSASLNKENLAVLLKEFFIFLGGYPFKNSIISLMSAKFEPRTQGTTLWIQYPFEEGLNITRNVTDNVFRDVCEKARISCRHLENNLNQRVTSIRDFETCLGITNLKRVDAPKSNRIDVRSVLEVDRKKRRMH